MVNRTTVPLALFPGVIVDGCAKAEYTHEQMQAGVERLFDETDDGWIPPGSVRYDLPVYARAVGDSVRVVIVVTSRGAEFVTPDQLQAAAPCEGLPVAQD